VDYFPIHDPGVATVLEASVASWIAPGDLQVTAMTCGLVTAPGGSAVRTFALMLGGTPSSVIACQIAGSATTCAVAPGSPEAVPAGTAVYVRDTVSGALTAAASHVSCTIYYAVDAL
jgi:hypothetical protein